MMIMDVMFANVVFTIIYLSMVFQILKQFLIALIVIRDWAGIKKKKECFIMKVIIEFLKVKKIWKNK